MDARMLDFHKTALVSLDCTLLTRFTEKEFSHRSNHHCIFYFLGNFSEHFFLLHKDVKLMRCRSTLNHHIFRIASSIAD